MSTIRTTALLAGLMASSPSTAEIIHRQVALPIPSSQNGLWINLETGASTTTATGPAGWDFNIYTNGGYASGPAAGGPTIVLYTGSTNGSGFMRYPGTTTGTPPELPMGAPVAAYGSFGAGTAQFGAQEGAWKLNESNYIGFKFRTADGLLRYGWARIDVGATTIERTLVEYAYESTPDTCIAVGAKDGPPPSDCSSPPPYDPCAGGLFACAPGSNLPIFNVTGTADLDLPASGCGKGFVIRRANWYPFDVPSTGTYRISLCGNATDTRLAILNACTPGAPVRACNDDFCAVAAAVDVALTAGERVWIVAGTASATAVMPAFLPVAIEAPFDPCAAPVSIPSGTTAVSAVNSTPQLDLAGHCDSGSVHPSILFKANYVRWTAPRTAYYAYSICNQGSTHIAVLTECGNAATALACSYDKCLAPTGAKLGFWADGGSEYVLAFGMVDPAFTMPSTVDITIEQAPPPPDPCGVDLLVARMGMQSIRLDMDFPNLPLAGSPCTFAIGDQALRYPSYLRFTPPVTGLYTIGNCTDTDPNFWGIYDLRIAVMAECGNARTIFACDDNGCQGDVPPWTATIRDLPLTAGETVFIGLGGNGPAAPGPFAFEISVVPTACQGDLNQDGTVGAADLAAILNAWGTAGADLNGDGTTDAADLASVLGAWGPCVP
jgi:hypothetical protein